MNIEISKYALAVATFYLLLLSNFLKEIFSCKLQKFLDNSMLAKHILGILMIYFLIIIVNPENIKKVMTTNIYMTLVIYLWFLVISRCNIYITLLILLLLILIYINNIYKSQNKDNKQSEEEQSEDKLSEEEFENKQPEKAKEIQKENKYDKIEKILSIIILLLTIFGFILYIFEKKLEYKEEFTWSKFMLGKTVCNFD